MNDTHAARGEPIQFLAEHIACRKDLGAYLDVTTKIHRAEAARTDEFLAQIRVRLEQARRQPSMPRSK